MGDPHGAAERGRRAGPAGRRVIRDPYTNRAAGQIALTVHMLFPFVLKRKGGWAQIAFKHTA